jgi:hypothetical protein
MGYLQSLVDVYEKAMNVVEDVKIGDHLRCFIQKTI